VLHNHIAFHLRGSFAFAFAEQGARANERIGHAACNRTSNRREATDRGLDCCTRRARSARGSSLTLAKEIVSEAFEDSPRAIEIGAITLRPLSVEDAPAVYAYASHPEVARFTLWPPHSSEEFSRQFLADLTIPTVVSWAIVLKEEPRLIGMIFLHSFSKRHKKAEIAFNVAKSSWNRGIATAAARAVLRFAFDQLILNRVEATCMIANFSSRSVLEKIGMSKEGTMRRSHYRHDGFHDMELFSILRDEPRG
jgi:[ribosomal protein S5]-alanine N-acetyltransferase